MIIVKLMGGLGNQLFQYAAGLSLANHLGVQLFIDNYYYKCQPVANTPRKFLLNHLDINVNVAPKREQYLGWMLFEGNKFQRNAGRILKYVSLSPYTFYREQLPFKYDKNLFNNNCNKAIFGYWQAYSYLNNIETQLRKIIIVKRQYRYEQRSILDICSKYSTVFVHVRRGDYVTNINASKYHILTSIDYYRAAIDKFKQELENPYFILFSDDTAWVQKNITPLLDNSKYIIFKSQENDGLDDFYHMTQCSHAITTNSTFSWWAAWLIRNNNKVVIAPKKWLKNLSESMNDLIPKSWITI